MQEFQIMKTAITLLNLSESDSMMEFNVPINGSYAIDILDNDKKYEIKDKQLNINVPAFGKMIIKIY